MTVEKAPPGQDRIVVLVPDDFEHGKSMLVWALKDVDKNSETLAIVHVHSGDEQTGLNDVKEKLSKYAGMCEEREVKCDVLPPIEDDDVVKYLQKHIELKHITNLVVGVEANKLYSEKTKSLNSETAIGFMRTEAPLCKIRFVTRDGNLIWTRGIIDATMLIPDDFASLLPMVEREREELDHKLQEVTLTKSELNKQKIMLKARSPNRHHAERMDNKKKYAVAKAEKLRLQKELKRTEAVIQFIKGMIGATMHILQERDTAVNETGGLDDTSGVQTTMALPAETILSSIDFYDKREIDESMQWFGNTLISEDSGSGSVQKGLLRGTVVAIKMLHPQSMQGGSEFLRKVALLGRVRHSNLATLMGACKEEYGLVYEFLPKGSLQVWLERRNEMQLIWQVRTKIILEIRKVLIFLHSNKPQPVVHGNLKPSKVLLDYNFACKLEASGISQSNGGKAAMKRDMQSFAIIILQLLTRLPQQDVTEVVEEAMEKGGLDTVLDDTAGKWPPALASQLARCGVEMSRDECPDLQGNMWKVLESHLMTVDILTSGQYDDAARDDYICPITLKVMEKPYFAADGYTYEYEAIREWIRRCQSNKTVVISPMTKEVLKHLDLTPNWRLHSSIQTWKEKQETQVRSLVCDCDPHPVQNSEGLLPPASSCPPTTLISSTTDAYSQTQYSIIAPPNASNDAANPSTAAPPPPRPLSPSTLLLLPPTRVRHFFG